MDYLTLDFIKKVLARVKNAGFDSAEVILVNEHMTEMQVDFSDISLLRNTESDQLRLRGIQAGRYATVSLNQVDDTSIQFGVLKLQEAAQSAPVDPHRAFAPKQDLPHTEMGPLEPLYYQMHDRVSQFLKSVSENYPECMLKQSILRYTRTHTLRANTAGLEADTTEACYNHGVRFLSKRNSKTSSINYSGAYASDLDVELLDWPGLRRSIESSAREIAVAPLHGTLTGRVVIGPEAFNTLLGYWLAHLRDERMIGGTSQLRNQMDKHVASPLLNLTVDPRNHAFARHEFMTEDGFGAQPSTIIEKGQLKSFLLTDYGSRKLGLERARNSGQNLVIEGGLLTLDQLFDGIHRGIYLGRVSGGAPANNGDFNLVAKNSFLIEDGMMTRPISEAIVSGNIFRMMGSIATVSKERANDGLTMIPWVCVENMTVVGR